ncbi:MAG: ABC transporter substrate-binding protein [Vicinamibacterales bacterium]
MSWTRPGKIVVSGAFTLDAWRPYDVLVMKKNPAYDDAAMVKLDTLILYPVEDLTTMMNLYKAGEVYATFNHTVPASWTKLIRRYKDYMDAPELATESYVFNTTQGPTADVRVRHALNMAVDKAALARFRQTVKPTTSVVPLNMFDGYPSPSGDPFDPAKAKTLLAAAGYKDAAGNFAPASFPVSEMEIWTTRPRATARQRSSSRRNGSRTSGSRCRCATPSSAPSCRCAAASNTAASREAAGLATTWIRSRS